MELQSHTDVRNPCICYYFISGMPIYAIHIYRIYSLDIITLKHAYINRHTYTYIATYLQLYNP